MIDHASLIAEAARQEMSDAASEINRLRDLLRRVHTVTPHSETDLWDEVHAAIEQREEP